MQIPNDKIVINLKECALNSVDRWIEETSLPLRLARDINT